MIRDMNPQQFVEMAELLKASAESEMDRMPSVRADNNFVRLMNLHKAKGLQGKIVIFLPRRVSAPKADSNVQRVGTDTLGWFKITDALSLCMAVNGRLVFVRLTSEIPCQQVS